MNSFTGVWVVDFGAQYSQLIARRVREASVYCEVVPWFKCMERLNLEEPEGIIFTGGPANIYEDNSPVLPGELFEKGIPILGICYGLQLMTQVLGGKVVSPEHKEYGRVKLFVDESKNSSIFDGVLKEYPDPDCWMSHTDYVEVLPDGFVVTSCTENCPTASIENSSKRLYGVQFHPEVHNTPFGWKLLENFLYKVCGCTVEWTMSNFVKSQISEIRAKVGDKKVIAALSGGVDSSVSAMITHKAIGDSLSCVFVDHGLLRKGEAEQVMDVYGKRFNIRIKKVEAGERFLSKLAGVTDPEQKRKIIGAEFIRVFEEESKKLIDEEGDVAFLLQGTIYPDVVESGIGDSNFIKSHHNVGGLPADMKLELLEPLRMLFKDEVRKVGEELGLAPELVWRQPFPGPGLAIRCLGEVTEEKLGLLRESDAIIREEIDAYNLDLFEETGLRDSEGSVWQYFTVLPNLRSVGVMGDVRTYDNTIGIRAVTSVDGMTSDWARLPYEMLERISNRIVNEVKGINRVVYDITSKPPSTIEWE